METTRLNKDDKILAMLTVKGNVIAQLEGIGCNSLSEIVSYLKHSGGIKHGLYTLFVRNFTQGWHINQPFYFSNSGNTEPKRERPNNINKSGQYYMIFN
ncbi:MAG: hypothetical protein PHR45_05200 [Muribaculaceae bacterium]|nr:hypothetical protein [Muribaculaceae bacterium]